METSAQQPVIQPAKYIEGYHRTRKPTDENAPTFIDGVIAREIFGPTKVLYLIPWS